MTFKSLLKCCMLIFVCYMVAVASGPYCDSLSKDQMRILERAQKKFFIPQCADMTIKSALENPGKCAMAPRLWSFASWLAYMNKDSGQIINELVNRYESLTSERKYRIDKTLFEIAGDIKSPVSIVVYISIGCPFCKAICALLYDSVTVGSLKGKAQVCVKLFSTSERDLTLLAAHACGKFWEYMKALSKIEKRLDEGVLLDAARKLGMPMNTFKAYMDNPTVKGHAHASREEGVRNGVNATPTVFINGRKYYSNYDPMWIFDAVEYEYMQQVELSK